MLLNSTARDSYGKEKSQGTNIEGLAVTGGRLYVGLRTPVDKDAALILSAPVAELFASGQQSLNGKSVEPISLKLGKMVGIRDLAALQSGGLLILSGPTIEQKDIPYKIWQICPRPSMRMARACQNWPLSRQVQLPRKDCRRRS